MLRVNILWFFSLTLSIACAVSATLVQQWARKYLLTTQIPLSPQRRARVRTYLFSRRTPFPAWYHCDCCTISPPRLSFPFLSRPYRLSLPHQPYPGVGPFGLDLYRRQDVSGVHHTSPLLSRLSLYDTDVGATLAFCTGVPIRFPFHF